MLDPELYRLVAHRDCERARSYRFEFAVVFENVEVF
jgi:hypothetical protein